MVLYFGCYLVAHLVLYVLVARHLAIFRTERAIFIYHALPALAVILTALGFLVVERTFESLAAGALMISLQGIYSLSFLELWSLAQGGYSISILTTFSAKEQAEGAQDLSGLREIGAAKKADRLAGLQKLGLIQTERAMYTLTRRGRLVAATLKAVQRLSNLKELG